MDWLCLTGTVIKSLQYDFIRH